ncbi:hypothetical protein [Streptomyces cylindrosporus]|uniref:Uncharacterized protein n=1 Tax=Streptomyces cylindrosporus TaxID=2927583 RepID=A0ABS9Y2I2_9ACTN|nr:hypothetical protein [Streptomyces cylindrosporus]MCI3271417.1 hypothetical protein [Streptomyces cylindrosporus]
MTTAPQHLLTVLRHWSDLQDALGAQTAPVWPPAGRMSDFLRALDQRDAEEVAYERSQALLDRILERADSASDAPGERPIPIRLTIHETMRVVQASLVHCADVTAAAVQRSPMPGPPAHWPAADRTRRELLALRDSKDPRRWKFVGDRTAVDAALWLYCRVTDQHGPFRPLSEAQRGQIANVAAGAAERVEQALDVGERTVPLTRPCPECGGRIEMHGGAGVSPIARCTSCGHIWTEQPNPAALFKKDQPETCMRFRQKDTSQSAESH